MNFPPYPGTLGSAGTLSAAALRGRAIGDSLQSGQSLQKGQSLLSKNGDYELVMQSDGNFVLYSRDLGAQGAIWSTGTYKGCVGQYVAMGTDGNLVVYGSRPCWASNTQGHSGARLIVQDDGNTVIYDTANKAIWTSGTEGGYPPGEMELFKWRDTFLALKSEIDKYTASHPSSTTQNDQKLADYMLKVQNLQRHGPHDAFGEALRSGITDTFGAITKIPVLGPVISAAVAPLSMTVSLSHGERIDHALLDAAKSQLGAIKAVAPYAAAIVSFIPGIGTGIAAALAAGIALAEGKPIDQALEEAVKAAIPGGALAVTGYELAKKVASGQNVGKAVLEAARSQLPPAAQKAFDVGLAVVSGKQIQDAITTAIVNLAPAEVKQIIDTGAKAIQAVPGLANIAKSLPTDVARQGLQLASGAFARAGVNEAQIRAMRSQLTGDMLKGFDAALKSQEAHFPWASNVTSAPPAPAPGGPTQAQLDLQALSKLSPEQQKQLVDLQALSKLTPEQQKQLVDMKKLSELTPDQQKQLVDLQALSKLSPQQQKDLVAYAEAQKKGTATPVVATKSVTSIPAKTTAIKPVTAAATVTTAPVAPTPSKYPPYPPM